ncbi:hypothetical protein V2G26_007586 [Clonostachys chloroleuca]|uniref:Major facilitator superfamily (MFS) profile domain-containing protein n=1 Tax=Clonostachys chloroleuca TaxID=1926264 RepID=A0AA35MDN1_9HYPO|nr:unnamed protein product [Clonostachys chloroleuca]
MGNETTSARERKRNDGHEVAHRKVESVALADAVAKDSPKYTTAAQFKLYGIMVFCTLNCIMNGYDGSVMGSINAMDTWHNYFGIGKTGSGIGLVTAIYPVGQVSGSFFAGLILDNFGRKVAMFIGACFIIIGSVVQATTANQNLNQFIGGRYLVGFGVPICVTAAPTYLVEMAYPTWRGLAGGAYNVFGWYLGAITATWTCYGTGLMPNQWSWRIPLIIQAVPAAIVACTVWLLPESPRWLCSKRREDEAREILVKYHGEGDPDSAVARLELEEMQQSLGIERESEHGQSRWWDYRVLFNSRPARYRMWIILMVAVFNQFTGGSVISYYLPTMIDAVGIKSARQQLLLNALNSIFSFCGGIAGAFFVDRLGRRPLLLWGVFLTGLVYIPINVIAAKAGAKIETGAGYAFIAMIYLYGIVSSFSWTPLQALYPAEILNNDIRAKGIACKNFLGGLSGFINMYATPIALGNIGWKTYTIFLVLHAVHWILMYFVTVETKGRSLEEIEEIFNDPNPVKRSKQKYDVVISQGVGVKLDES